MSEKEKEGEFQRDIELAKIGVFSSHNQTLFNLGISLIAGLFFAGTAISYSRYSANLVTINELNLVIGFGYIFSFVICAVIYRWYNKRVKKIGELLILIEKGKRLPTLKELVED